MQTIKTAVVVVMLLAVLYGAYVALNGTDTPLPRELEQVADLNVEMGNPMALQGNSLGGGNNFFANTGNNGSGAGGLPPLPVLPGNSNPPLGQPPQQGNGNTSGFNLTAPPLANGSAPSPFPSQLPAPTLSLPPSNAAVAGNTSNSGMGSSLVDTGKPFEPLTPGNGATGNGTNSGFAGNQGTTLPPMNPPALNPPTLNPNSLNPPSLSSSTSSPTPLNPPMLGSNGNNSLPDSTLGGFPVSTSPDRNSFANSIENKSGSLEAKNPPSLSENNSVSGTTGEWSGLPNSTTTKSFQNAKTMAMEQASKGELKEALATLSLFYSAPELTHDQHQELLELLDPLAGEVIYSRRHLLESAYTVAQGETLEQIAKQFQVPSDLLGRINAIESPQTIPAGTKIKVVPGPFRAEVDLTRSEMTLFLGELYAGRFAVEVGADPSPKEGIFQIVEKQKNRNFYGKGGVQIAGNDPRNPYGGIWMDLGQEICIHGTPSQPAQNAKEMGCISLSPIDAGDVFGMLSRGSQVQIRR